MLPVGVPVAVGMPVTSCSSNENLSDLNDEEQAIRRAWRLTAAKARRGAAARSKLSINTQLAAGTRAAELLEENTPTQFDLSPLSAPARTRRGQPSTWRSRGRAAASEPPPPLPREKALTAMTAAFDALVRGEAERLRSSGGGGDDDGDKKPALTEEEERPFYSPKGVEEAEAEALNPVSRPPSPGRRKSEASAPVSAAATADFDASPLADQIQARTTELEFNARRPAAAAPGRRRQPRGWSPWCCAARDS